MPELPEVETIRRHLRPVLEGSAVTSAEVRRPRMTRRHERPGDVVDRLTGRRILALNRRGKFLIAPLEGDITWVSHLGMSGRFSVNRPGDPEEPHTNVVVRLDNGAEVRFVDPRTFGFVAAFTPMEFANAMRAVGRDALEDLPTADQLSETLRDRTASIKALLLDQRIVAGLGNIYADEALHQAGVAPSRAGGSLAPDDIERLRRGIRSVLDSGLAHGGTSLDDLAYLLPDGRAGENLSSLLVYGREDEACNTCGSAIRRVVIRGRSSFWCPSCQS
jgi:formamidopyrimidine-DNA glycosylase